MKQIVYCIVLLTFLIANYVGKAFASESSITPIEKKVCSVSCLNPTIVGGKGDKLIRVLKATTRALADHDFKSLASYLDINCTTYNETTRKMVVGRDNIIRDVKELAYAEESRLQAPAVSYVIDHPYVRIAGNQAVVTFVLIKEIGGLKPTKFESNISDVFIKRDGEWKKLHFLGETWKEIH